MQLVDRHRAEVGERQLAVGAEDERDRERGGAEGVGQLAVLVGVLREGDAELGEEVERPVGALADVDADEPDVGAVGADGLERRQLAPAGCAPRRPQVDDGRAVELAELERRTLAGQRRQRQVRQSSPGTLVVAAAGDEGELRRRAASRRLVADLDGGRAVRRPARRPTSGRRSPRWPAVRRGR